MMRIDLWFDFNDETSQVIKNLEEAISTFANKSLVRVNYRSFTKSSDTFYHELYQYGRRNKVKEGFLNSIFKLNKISSRSISSLFETFNLNENDFKEKHDALQLVKIVNAHNEHATLQKIKTAPTITFSHGFRLTGLVSTDEIKDKLILMYEKESGIEYCEEDCER